MAILVQIQGYDSLEQIGVGGMAAVYKARKVSIDKTVAIKVLFPYLANDASFIDRFQREAKAAARIQHENIVNVIDFGESGGSYFIVMEYYDGPTLEDLLRSRDSLPLDIAVQVLLEVCYGLESAHAQDIVHRDIKPGNIIYTRSGGLKIADFGLAKNSDSMTVITQQGKVIGTPAYMSPEQAAGANVGPASDIFSMGVVAYELFCQRKPFEGNSYSEVLEKIQTHDPPSLVNVNPLIRPDIENIIAKMLEKDESKRYQSTSDVIADVESAMETLKIARDRRKLASYIQDPDAYDAAFKEKAIARCLSQGAFYLQKGQSHLDDAMLEFRRILHLDPTNERARKHLERIVKERGEKDKTLALDAAATPGAAVSRAGPKKKRVKVVSASGMRRHRTARRLVPAIAVVATLAVVGYVGVERGFVPTLGMLATANTHPLLSAPRQLGATAGQTVEFSLQAQDADGDALEFRAKGLPKGAALDDAGRFEWRPGYAQAGTHTLTFIVDDGRSTSRAQTVIEVAQAALSIDFDRLRAISVQPGQRATRRLSARAESGGKVRFELEGGPEGMKVEGDRLVYDAPAGAKGKYRARLVASDGYVRASQTLAVNVSRPRGPDAPVRGSVEWRLPEAANIYVDGALKKRNARRIDLDLASGRHTLQAELASGVTAWSQVVDVRAGERTALDAPALQYGSLSVYFLGAVGEFQVNGKPFAEQPPFTGVRMPTGEHVVSCRLAGDDNAREFTISIEAGKETIIEYELGNDPAVAIEG